MVKRVTKAMKSAADDVEAALDEIARKSEGRFEEAKEQVKASDEYGWWRRQTSQRKFAIGSAVAMIVFLLVAAGIRAMLAA
jgi:hypothetical protein